MGNNRKSKSLADWLSLESRPDLYSVKWLGPFVTTIAGIFLLGFILLTLVLIALLFDAALNARGTDGAAIRNIGLVVLAFLGGPFLVWRTIVAAKLAETSDDVLFNEKITGFANQLAARRQITRVVFAGSEEKVLTEWEDDLVARAAAIDGLEGLASERPQVAPRVVRLVANYIRGTFPCNSLEPSEKIEIPATPRMDLQKSTDLVGRLLTLAANIDSSNWRLDLTNSNFDGVNLSNGFFRAVNFSGSRFEGATFNQGNFEGAFFTTCLLNYADFFNTNLIGAKFDYAIINEPKLANGSMANSVNFANIKGATFIATDLSALDYLGAKEEIEETFGTRKTIVSDVMREDMPNSELHTKAFRLRLRKLRGKNLSAEQESLVNKLEDTGFQNWVPWSTEGGFHLSELRKDLGLNLWPFDHT